MKEELFKKAKEHINYLEQEIEQNKQDRKKQRGHLFHNKYESIPLGSSTTIGYSIGLSALLLFVAKIPLGIAIAAGCLGGFVGSFVVPRIIHYSILKFAKGKLGRGYAKLEVDNHFKVMKWFYKKYYQNLLRAKSSDEVSNSELQAFANQVHIFAENGKYNLDQGICKKITKRNKKDLLKIENLSNKIANREVLEKKVQKIIEKNNKFTKPWCEVYNSCALKMRDLYIQANKMDSSLEIPKDYEFGLNYQALQNMVAKHINKSLVVTQKAFDKQELEDNQTREEIRKQRESIPNRNKTYNNDNDFSR